jgi:hypothetical protein
MLRRLTTFTAALVHNPAVRVPALTLYYLGVLGALLYLYGRGDFATPPFIYQAF